MKGIAAGNGWFVRRQPPAFLLFFVLVSVAISCGRASPAAPTPLESEQPGPGTRYRRDNFGVGVDQITVHTSPATVQELFSAARDAGIRWGRIYFDREPIHPGPGRFDWNDMDRIVATATSNRVQLLGILGGTPLWDTTGPQGSPEYTGYPPRSYDAWGDYVFRTVTRYRSRVRHWEIWNEPDTGPPGGFWLGTPSDYARLLAVAYRETKRADAGARVLLGGITMDDEWFFHSIMADRNYPAGSFFDVMSVHLYGTRFEVQAKFARSRSISDKPIWVTEMGWPADPGFQTADQQFCCGEEGKGRYLKTVMPELVDLGAEKVFWWTLWLAPEGSQPFPLGIFQTYGLLDPQKRPTTAYLAFRELMANLP